MNNHPPEQVLISRGVMERHAKKAAALMTCTDRPWASYRDQATAAPDQLTDGGMVFLIGKRGMGKTQISACLLYDCFARRRMTIRYIRFAELCMRFRDAIKNGSEVATLRDFSAQQVLVIDDIHEQAGTPHEQRSLTALVDERLGRERLTVMVGNVTEGTLAAALGPSVTSRSHEGRIIIEVDGKYYREAQR